MLRVGSSHSFALMGMAHFNKTATRAEAAGAAFVLNLNNKADHNGINHR